MKNRPFIYVILAFTLIAIIWRISNPPQLPIPGPIGSPSNWNSASSIGVFVSTQINPDASKVAALWVDTKLSDTPRSGLRVINTKDNTQTSILLPENFKSNGLSWNNDILTVAGSTQSGKWQFIEVSPSSKSISVLSNTNTDIGNIISWPPGSRYLLSEKSTLQNTTLTVYNQQGSAYGQSVDIPNCSVTNWSQVNTLAQRGDCAVVSVLPNSDTSGFPNVYFCDFQIGKAKLISNRLPGRIHEVLVSRQGVLIVCVLRGQCTSVLYNPSDSKLSLLKSVPVKWAPNTLWPNTNSPISLFVNDSLIQLDLSTLSVTKIFTYKDIDATSATWQTQVAGARCFPRGNADYISINTDTGEPDIRRFAKSESENKYIMTPILPR